MLHDLLREIGFIEWAQVQGNAFLFLTLTSLKDPRKQASSENGHLGARMRGGDNRQYRFSLVGSFSDPRNLLVRRPV